MTQRKIQTKDRTVAKQSEAANAERELKRLGNKAAESIGGKTAGMAKPKLSPELQEKLDRGLFCAIVQGKPDVIGRLLKAGANANSRDDRNMTPLEYAVSMDSNFIALYIPRDNSDVKQRMNKIRKELTEVLLKNGVDATKPGPTSEYLRYYQDLIGSIAREQLQNKIRRDMVRILLRNGAEVNPEGAQMTPLMRAVVTEDLGLVKLLLERGADLYARGSYGDETVFYYALRRKDILEFLEEEAEKRKPGSATEELAKAEKVAEEIRRRMFVSYY